MRKIKQKDIFKIMAKYDNDFLTITGICIVTLDMIRKFEESDYFTLFKDEMLFFSSLKKYYAKLYKSLVYDKSTHFKSELSLSRERMAVLTKKRLVEKFNSLHNEIDFFETSETDNIPEDWVMFWNNLQITGEVVSDFSKDEKLTKLEKVFCEVIADNTEWYMGYIEKNIDGRVKI